MAGRLGNCVRSSSREPNHKETTEGKGETCGMLCFSDSSHRTKKADGRDTELCSNVRLIGL